MGTAVVEPLRQGWVIVAAIKGVVAAFCDGHVQFLSESVPLATLQQLAHRADGKLLSGEY